MDWAYKGMMAAGAPRRAWRTALRGHYRQLLGWAFTLFATLRVVAYLPTLALIWQQGDSSQHSLLTWLIWLGGNLTMAAWLHETAPGRNSKAILVNLGNATMCLAGVVTILWFRL
ncbi:hypothetical protein [Piscinibacter sp.]|uniref:hypothetical protein n=1 Tax=Piscinibacter sp. TaxID=1903157 RepID=UPI0039E4F537